MAKLISIFSLGVGSAALYFAMKNRFQQDVIVGPPGPMGPRGYAGMTGSEGPPGLNGKDGDKGENGDRGETGPQGPAGARGADGKDGEKGANGAKGAKGEKGDVGPRGPASFSNAHLIKDGGVDITRYFEKVEVPGVGYAAKIATGWEEFVANISDHLGTDEGSYAELTYLLSLELGASIQPELIKGFNKDWKSITEAWKDSEDRTGYYEQIDQKVKQFMIPAKYKLIKFENDNAGTFVPEIYGYQSLVRGPEVDGSGRDHFYLVDNLFVNFTEENLLDMGYTLDDGSAMIPAFGYTGEIFPHI